MAELEALQDNFQQFADNGAALVALCPQRQSFNRIAAEELELSFPVLRDFDNQIATAFGLTLETPPDNCSTFRFADHSFLQLRIGRAIC